jgi:hypothetical protein
VNQLPRLVEIVGLSLNETRISTNLAITGNYQDFMKLALDSIRKEVNVRYDPELSNERQALHLFFGRKFCVDSEFMAALRHGLFTNVTKNFLLDKNAFSKAVPESDLLYLFLAAEKFRSS